MYEISINIVDDTKSTLRIVFHGYPMNSHLTYSFQIYEIQLKLIIQQSDFFTFLLPDFSSPLGALI